MNPSERQASSRQARKKAGGKAVHVVLTPSGAEALHKLIESGYAENVTLCIEKCLIDSFSILSKIKK